MFNRLIFFFAVLMSLSACQEGAPTQKSEQLFTLLSSENTGISFSNNLIDDPLDNDRNVMSFYNYFNGGGVAIADFNNDGLEDVVFTGNEVPHRFYLNKGDFRFEDITEKTGINNKKKWSTGISVVDINNDGWQDIYICQSSQFNKPPQDRKNLLFINNKDLSFTEQAEAYGLADMNISEQALFFDMDKDGDQDCFIVNNSIYVRIPIPQVLEHIKVKKNLEAASSNLYRNDNGKFVKVTEEAGVLRYGFGLSASITDINNDGWLDIYQANDYSVPDFMYINQGDGTFKDEINTRTKQISWFSMGSDIADFDNDGNVDIGVVDMSATNHIRGKTLMAAMNPDLFYYAIDNLGYQRQHMFNTMQLNNGDGTFNNVAGITNLLSSEWSWAAFFADFDNDGWKDYFVANGFRRYARDNDSRIRMDQTRQAYGGSIPMEKRKELYEQIPEVKIPNYIYKNIGGLDFKEQGKTWGTAQPSYSNGAAYGDLDNDGDLDLVVNNIDSEAFVYRNNADKNYLQFDLNSPKSKVGTRIVLKQKDKMQMQECNFVRGFQSANTQLVHFGLGDDTQIEEMTVVWPDGMMEKKRNLQANKRITLNYADAKSKKSYDSNAEEKYFALSSKAAFVHKENYFDDYEKEVLVPYKQSTLGPFISKADVNGDNREDFFIGGAKGQSGKVFLQTAGGKFQEKPQSWPHASREDMGSHFFDADGDGDQDLYVISAGNDFLVNDAKLSDRLYKNDGKGNFSFEEGALPKILDGGSRVKSSDIDQDGDLDLFVAGRLIPGNYPNVARSYILENDKGKFTDVTDKWSEELMHPGLVNDFIWTDVNADAKDDLILVGEWMPVKIFINTGTGFEDQSAKYLKDDLKGWWFKIHEEDMDGDGDKDIVLGNLGLNSKFHATKKKPLKMYANDFDGNGSCDVVLVKEFEGKDVPVRGRECSSQQMPFIIDNFKTYEEFANASVQDILGVNKIKDGIMLESNTFESGVLINDGGKYTFKAFPRKAQVSPIMGFVTTDINKDGLQDIVLAGNIYNMEIETPRLDASDGLVMLNTGDMEFSTHNYLETGFKAAGDVKDLQLVEGPETKSIVVANNNGPLEIFALKANF